MSILKQLKLSYRLSILKRLFSITTKTKLQVIYFKTIIAKNSNGLGPGSKNLTWWWGSQEVHQRLWRSLGKIYSSLDGPSQDLLGYGPVCPSGENISKVSWVLQWKRYLEIECGSCPLYAGQQLVFSFINQATIFVRLAT